MDAFAAVTVTHCMKANLDVTLNCVLKNKVRVKFK